MDTQDAQATQGPVCGACNDDTCTAPDALHRVTGEPLALDDVAAYTRTLHTVRGAHVMDTGGGTMALVHVAHSGHVVVVDADVTSVALFTTDGWDDGDAPIVVVTMNDTRGIATVVTWAQVVADVAVYAAGAILPTDIRTQSLADVVEASDADSVALATYSPDAGNYADASTDGESVDIVRAWAVDTTGYRVPGMPTLAQPVTVESEAPGYATVRYLRPLDDDGADALTRAADTFGGTWFVHSVAGAGAAYYLETSDDVRWDVYTVTDGSPRDGHTWRGEASGPADAVTRAGYVNVTADAGGAVRKSQSVIVGRWARESVTVRVFEPYMPGQGPRARYGEIVFGTRREADAYAARGNASTDGRTYIVVSS
jgi:hypothetical protein